MGRDKAFVEVDGEPLAGRVAQALEGAGASSVLAVGGDRRRLSAIGLAAVADRHPGEGPLGGVLTAFTAASTEVVVVLACDLVAPSARSVASVVDGLEGDADAAVAWPVAGGHPQVLHAAWRAHRAGPALAAAFAAGERSLRRAAAGLAHVALTDVPAPTLRGANAPADLPSRSRRHNGPMTDRTPINEVDVAGLADAHADGAYVLDVRQPEEYEAGHVPGAVLIPLDQLGGRIAEVPQDRPLYVICKSGGRSAAAVEALAGAGYDATNVAGGTTAWIEAGHRTVTGPDAGER